MPHPIFDYLALAKVQDAETGASGARTTRQVADHCGLSTSYVYERLSTAAEDGTVTAFHPGAFGRQGVPILWTISSKD